MKFIAHLMICSTLLLWGCTNDEEDAQPGDAVIETPDGQAPALPPGNAYEKPPALPDLSGFCDDMAKEKKEWALEQNRYSLSIFHFNIQYVAGGLNDELGTTASNEEIEDAIIVESFAPLVDLFDRHPNWGASFEMQGYMLEVMALRHPEIAKKFFRLVRRGQLDLMSFHWSGQLVTALTKQDMDWSWAENQTVFESLCLPRTPVHFLQEGQFGPGIALYAQQKDGEMVVLPKNLLKYQVDPVPEGLIHYVDGRNVLVTSGYQADDMELHWNFVDDGELIATGDIPPYLLPKFKHDPEYLKKEYEDKLTKLESEGYVIAPVSHYLKVIEKFKIQPAVVEPPILDGTWQPQESGNMYLWMGGSGQSPGDERDNELLTNNVRVRQKLAAVSMLLDEAPDDETTTLWKAWFRYGVRQLMLAQVSDTTGWRPVDTEVKYGFEHHQKAEGVANALAERLLTAFGHTLPAGVDVATGQVLTADSNNLVPGVEKPGGPLAVGTIVVDTSRLYSTKWTYHGTEYQQLEVTIQAGETAMKGAEQPPAVRVTIPVKHDAIQYSPALWEHDARTFPLSDYAFIKNKQRFGLALPNGLFGLADDWTLVLDQSSVNLAANLTKDSVYFEDETLPPNEEATWRFRFYPKGVNDVLEAANRLNLTPIVWFEK